MRKLITLEIKKEIINKCENGMDVVQEIVCVGSSMFLEVNEEDVEELVEEHRSCPLRSCSSFIMKRQIH